MKSSSTVTGYWPE
jgi:plasmid stabilization system protein ParE